MTAITTTYCDLKGCSDCCEGPLTNGWITLDRVILMMTINGAQDAGRVFHFCTADHAVLHLETT